MEELGSRMAADIVGGLFRTTAALVGAALAVMLIILTILEWLLNG